MIRYVYKGNKYFDLFNLRQAIWENQNIAFGELTDDLKNDLGIIEENYDPRDDWSVEQWESSVRAERDSLLAESDYFVMPDYPASEKDLGAVRQYRQSLRDISKQSGFPKTTVFPEKPSVLKDSKKFLSLARVGIYNA